MIYIAVLCNSIFIYYFCLQLLISYIFLYFLLLGWRLSVLTEYNDYIYLITYLCIKIIVSDPRRR